MKCPHCGTSIHDAGAAVLFFTEPQRVKNGIIHRPAKEWSTDSQVCSECRELIVFIGMRNKGTSSWHRYLVYPRHVTRPLAPEVPDPYRRDFLEACAVISASPKASAALSRRTLQAVLRDKAATTAKDLYDQIEEVVASGKVPSHIVESLHAVRMIGNFAAHPTKNSSTGEIVDVEDGEAEWNLDVLESLFDFYFVQPALTAKRKAELNKKLKDAGKPEIK